MWVTAELRGLVELDIGERNWDIAVAQLSHTPMSKEAGRAHMKQAREIARKLEEPIVMFDRSREKAALRSRRAK